MDAETEQVLNEFSFLGSESEDASHELRMQTDSTDWGTLLVGFSFPPHFPSHCEIVSLSNIFLQFQEYIYQQKLL